MNTTEYKILLVDDEEDILEFLSYNLKKEGYSVSTAENGKEALEKAKTFLPHLIILDVMMPEMDGMETCEKIRTIPSLANTGIAFLTARGEDYSQIAGFEAGADDYIQKPVKPKVFLSRVKALLKRVGNNLDKNTEQQFSSKKYGDIEIDKDRYLIIQNGVEFSLPRKEFELLMLLVSRPQKVFTRDEIYSSVWGEKIIVGDRTIDVHIRKLREKIGDHYIKTVKGVGYKFVE
ncbi:MAG: response regulator transcription factor [Marinifilaceae bacterium]|jgi:two-component system alkaline phosphatase synthesis response regulator PhoP|nr:response regulator transcription factor [Marinifilaceae bacterium]